MTRFQSCSVLSSSQTATCRGLGDGGPRTPIQGAEHQHVARKVLRVTSITAFHSIPRTIVRHGEAARDLDYGLAILATSVDKARAISTLATWDRTPRKRCSAEALRRSQLQVELSHANHPLGPAPATAHLTIQLPSTARAFRMLHNHGSCTAAIAAMDQHLLVRRLLLRRSGSLQARWSGRHRLKSILPTRPVPTSQRPRSSGICISLIEKARLR
jgi:hypothetical protein